MATKSTRREQAVADEYDKSASPAAVLGMRLPGPGAVYISQTLNFRGPVRIGDVVSVVVEVVELVSETRRCRLKCECLVDGKVVLEGEAVVMVPSSKPKVPKAG